MTQTNRQKIAERFAQLEKRRERALQEDNYSWAEQISGELVGLQWVLNNCFSNTGLVISNGLTSTEE